MGTSSKATAKPVISIDVPTDVDNGDVYSLATMPFHNNMNVNISNNDESDTPNDLLMCRMELKNAKAENKRKDEEIKRLKAVIQALTASLTG